MTGRTLVRHGSDSARTTRSVIISDAPQPAAALSSSSLSFGTVGVGKASAPQTIAITDTGTAPLTIAGSTVSGPAAADYKLSADACTGQAVAPASACTVVVTFTPGGEGARSRSFAFTDDASGSPHTISLSGQGTSTGILLGTVTESGKPLPGSVVRACVPPGFGDCRSATAAADGSYSLPGLPLGPRSIEVTPGSGSSASASSQLIVVAGENRRRLRALGPEADQRRRRLPDPGRDGRQRRPVGQLEPALRVRRAGLDSRERGRERPRRDPGRRPHRAGPG